MNRPPELEQFFKKHGKPLEVGMVVRLNIFRDDKYSEYTVFGIDTDPETEKIVCFLVPEIPWLQDQKNISPLDLTPKG